MLGVERNRNQETGSFQELLELVISGKCMHSRYPHKTPGIKNSCKIARSCSTPNCGILMTPAIAFFQYGKTIYLFTLELQLFLFANAYVGACVNHADKVWVL